MTGGIGFLLESLNAEPRLRMRDALVHAIITIFVVKLHAQKRVTENDIVLRVHTPWYLKSQLDDFGDFLKTSSSHSIPRDNGSNLITICKQKPQRGSY